MDQHIKSEELEDYVAEIYSSEHPSEEVFQQAIDDLEVKELSLLLEALPLEERLQHWNQIPEAKKANVLIGMRDQARDAIISHLNSDSLNRLLTGLDAESLIELSDNLSEELITTAFKSLSLRDKEVFYNANQFEANCIGRYVDHAFVTVPLNAKIKDAMMALKSCNFDFIDHIYVVDRVGVFRGILKISELLAETNERRLIREMMNTEVTPILAHTVLSDAAEALEHSMHNSLPVVDKYNRFIGRMTQAIALWIQKETLESRIMAQAGLKESTDLFVPVWKGANSRAIWLGINLLTAFLASWTIGLFADVLSQVVALAVLMPVVASMGGIAGSQTLTLIIRGIATGQVTFGNALSLAKQELSIAAINGIAWAVVISLVTYFWFESISISGIIAFAVMTNIVIAALSGVYIPVLLDRFKIDPALSGAVILTTVTDVFGFLTFLGLGTLMLI